MRPQVQSGSRYQVLRRLGIGGMAEVFLVRDRDGELIALKRLLGDDLDRMDLFLDEARITARFTHPNIVRVHELGCDELGLYIAMEYVPGRPLSAVLTRARRGAPVTCRLAAHIVAEVARALDHVHRAVDADGTALAVVHRDVSPSNVLVSMSGEVKLTDFGIAKARDVVHRTRTGVVRGTAGYMSPEQVTRAPVGGKSDVWSAGVVLWEASLGRPLFEGEDVLEVYDRIAAGLVEPPSRIDPAYPADLEEVVMAALARDPAKRCDAAALLAGIEACLARLGGPPCRDELAASMARWFAGDEPHAPAADEPKTASARPLALAGEPGGAGSATSSRPASRSSRRRSWRLAALTAGALGAAMFGVIASRGEKPHPPDPRPPELDAAWRIAQRGGHEQAQQILDDLLDAHPGHPEVATLAVLVHWWLGTPRIEPLVDIAESARLTPGWRALVRMVALLHSGRNAEAVMALQALEDRGPESAEIAYALGEARWHNGDQAGGVAMLAAALRRDPRWQMALHHVVDYHVARGEVTPLRDAAAVLVPSDPAAARALEIVALIAERRYAEAVAAAREATGAFPDDVPLWQHRAAAEVLAGELTAAAASADRAMSLWPIDERARGPFAQWAELYLYRGDEQGFASALGSHFSPANLLRLALWHDGAGLKVEVPNRLNSGPGRRLLHSAMPAPPIFECADILGPWRAGVDASAFWATSPHAEVRAFGAGLAALDSGELAAAEARFAEAQASATAETRPLFSYFLARTRRDRGDVAGAASACDEVIRPRGYVPYRAVLLPDCLRWANAP